MGWHGDISRCQGRTQGRHGQKDRSGAEGPGSDLWCCCCTEETMQVAVEVKLLLLLLQLIRLLLLLLLLPCLQKCTYLTARPSTLLSRRRTALR